MLIEKRKPTRDRRYLDALRSEPCIICGLHATPDNPVEAAHVGTAGKGLKSPDSEALPMHHTHHSMAHQMGEMTYLRANLPADVLREALRAYGRERYREWKEG